MLTPRIAGLLTAATALLLAGCGGAAEADPAPAVIVTATDSRCDLDRTQLEPGTMTFKVTNQGNQVTEVYVYGAANGAYTTVISEVENIGPGLSRDLTAELSPGTYEVACKPGQTGSGIRTRITVVGGTTTPSAKQEAAYDRELELTSDGRTISGDLSGAHSGEKIEFKLANRSDRPLILELKKPTGDVADETEPIPPGRTGEIIVDLTTGGNWTIIVESNGHDDLTATLPVA
jgi:iron uptake system component EfeO